MKACGFGGAARWSLSITATALLLSSCTHPVVPQTKPFPAPPLPATQLAQVGYGAQADFVRCLPPMCPARTPKTLSTTPNATAPETPASEMPPVEEPDSPIEATGAPPEATPTIDAVAAAIAERQSWSVPFAFGSAQLGATAKTVLSQAIAGLPSDVRITIAGRTDDSGPAAVNEALAQARAEAVRQHLAHARPELAAAMTVESEGRCCFAAPNDTAAGRARNRRVEITAETRAPPD